eukprot:5481563-Amphidinium_carterae.1
MVRGELSDCDRLPTRGSTDARAEKPSQKEQRECRKRGKRQVWRAPDWVHSLATSRQGGDEIKLLGMPSAPVSEEAARAAEELQPQ